MKKISTTLQKNLRQGFQHYMIDKVRFVLAITVMIVLGYNGVHGQIVRYAVGTASLLPVSNATNCTATNLTHKNGATQSGGCGNGLSILGISTSGTYTTASPCVEYQVKPSACYQLNITGMSAALRRSNTGATTAQYTYSTDGGSSWSTYSTSMSLASTSSCISSASNSLGNKSQSVTVTNPTNGIIIRIYPMTASGTGGNFQMYDWQLLGTVTAVTPTVNVSTTSLTSFGTLPINTASSNSTFTVDGSGFTNGTMVITPPTGFKIGTSAGSLVTTPITLTPTSGTISTTTIYVAFNPTAATSYSGNITVVGCGTTKNVAVSGTGSNLTKNSSSFNGTFGNVNVGTFSSSSSFTVTATNIANNVFITPPSGFEVRTGAGAYQSTPLNLSTGSYTKTVDVRFAPTAATSYSGNVVISSTGFTSVNLSCTGTGLPVTASVLNPISFATNAINKNKINLSWNLNAHSDSVMLVYKRVSSFTDRPIEFKSYSVGDTIGSGDTVIYIGTGTSFSHTGLLPQNQYYYKIFSDSSHVFSFGSGAHDSTYFPGNSTSDIINTSGFTYSTNIDYSAYQSATGLTTSNSVAAMGLTMRDGGSTGNDRDTSNTTLSAISFTVGNFANVRTAALFDSAGNNLSEVAVTSGTVAFSGLNYSAPDNGNSKLTLRITYRSTVTDSQRVTFTVSSTTANTTSNGSLFSSSNAGGAVSSTSGSDNIIIVRAKKIVFGQQPTSVLLNTSISPAVTVKAVDLLGNTDINYSNNITLTSTLGTISLGGSATASAGVATFSTLRFSAGTVLTVKASDATFSDVISDTFYIITTIYTNSGVTNNSSITQPSSAITTATNVNGTGIYLVNGATGPAYTSGSCATLFNWDPRDKIGCSSGCYNTPLDTSKGAVHFIIKPTLGNKLVMTSLSMNLGTYLPTTGGADSVVIAYRALGSTKWLTGITGASNNGKVKITASTTNCATSVSSVFDLSTPIASKNGIEVRIYAFHEYTQGDESMVNTINVKGQVYPVPNTAVNTTGFSNNFYNVPINTISASDSFTVSGANLGTNPVTLTSPIGFEICATKTGVYNDSLIFSPVAGSITNKKVYVRFTPTVATAYSGNIFISTIGVTPDLTVLVTGNGVNNLVKDPKNLTATVLGSTQIKLDYLLNPSSDTVVIAYDSSATFGNLIDGVKYNVGDLISGGGEIVYIGKLTSFTKSLLTPEKRYYFKVFSDSTLTYSAGITTDAKTFSPYYPIYLNPSLYSSNVVTADPNVTATDWSGVNGAGVNPFACTYQNFNLFSNTTYATTNKAIEFSITPKLGYKITVKGFYTQVMAYLAGSGGANIMRLAYSKDNGATWIDNGANVSIPATSSCAPIMTPAQRWTLTTPFTSTTKVMFRVYPMGETNPTGEINTAYDTIYGAVTEVPSINYDTVGFKSGNFGSIFRYTTKTQTYKVSAANLIAPLNVTVTNPAYKIRVGSNPFSSSVTLTPDPAGDITAQSIDVMFSPTTVGTFSTGIVMKSTGADSVVVPIIGIGKAVPDVTNVRVLAISERAVSLKWKLNITNDSVFIVRGHANTFAEPSYKKSYYVGDTLGLAGDSVIYAGKDTTFIDSILNFNTVYHYKVFSRQYPHYAVGVYGNDTTFPNGATSYTDYFRSKAVTGSWNGVFNWESSHDGVIWQNSYLFPDENAKSIEIQAGSNITLASGTTMNNITVDGSGILTYTGGTISLKDDGTAAPDMTIRGTYVINTTSATANPFPTSTGTGTSSIVVEANGQVRVDACGLNGLADDFLHLAANSSRITFQTDAVYNWNDATKTPETNGITYFATGNTFQPIFRITTMSTATAFGGASTTIINGVLDLNMNLTMVGIGTKTFRNGITGTGNLIQSTTPTVCGQFITNGTTAKLGGAGSIALNTNGLSISSTTTMNMTSNKTINRTATVGTISLNGGLYCNTYTLSGTAHLTTASGSTIETGSTTGLNGAITLSGTVSYHATGMNFVFDGTSNQVTGSALPGTIVNLGIGGNSEKSLTNNLTANGVVTMTAGTLTTDGGTVSKSDDKILTLGSTASIASETNDNYIRGVVKTTRTLANDSVQNTFGNIGVAITIPTLSPTNPGTTVVIRYNGIYAADRTDDTLVHGSKTYRGINRVFDITPTNNGNLDAGMVFSYFDNELNGVSATGLDIFTAHGTNLFKWRGLDKSGIGGGRSRNSNNDGGYLFLGMNGGHEIDQFSEWTAGGSSNPLPVSWVGFEASLMGSNTVLLQWQTAQEINNERFEAERSIDGISWNKIGTEKASSNPNQLNSYNLNDTKLPFGANILYYRIKQIDYDGQSDYTEIKKVNLTDIVKEEVKVWMNKGNNSLNVIAQKDIRSIQVLDLSGKTVLMENVTGKYIQVSTIEFSKGIYLLRTNFTDGSVDTQKLMKY